MPAIMEAYLPGYAAAVGLGAFLVVGAGFALVGGAVAGRRGLPELVVLNGWAAVLSLFTLIGAMRVVSFTAIAIATAMLAVGAAVWLARTGRPLVDARVLRTAMLGAPLFLIVSDMAPSMWDEFTNWLPNVRYLIEQNAFPGAGLPRNPSVFPAYPYALPLVGYLTSRIAGYFVENAVALLNLTLLLTLGLIVVRSMREMLAADARGGSAAESAGGLGPPGWGWCALAALLPTVLNPTFVHKIAFTAYADTATAATLGVVCALGWRCLNALAAGRREDTMSMAWQIGLASAALVSVKQANLVLLLAAIGLFVVVAARDPRIAAGALWRLAPAALALPFVVYAVWRLYIGTQIAGGEFHVRPFSEWLIPLVPDIVARMALIASKKGGYFGIMLVAVFFGIRGLWRMRTEFDRLAVIAAGLFLAYNFFLLLAYVAAFGEGEARYAASYWRYNMHIGGVCILFIGCSSAILWRRYGRAEILRWLPLAAVAAVLLLPLALIGKLRFDLHPRYVYARETTRAIATILRPEDRILLVDMEQNGQYQIIMRYYLHGKAVPVGMVTAFQRTPGEPEARTLRGIIERTGPTHVWVYRPLPAITDVFGMDLAHGMSHLLRRSGTGWRLAGSWPHPS